MVVKTTRVEVVPTVGKITRNSSTMAGQGKKKAGKKKKQTGGQAGGKVNWKKVGKAIMSANKFIKDNKIISRGATFLSDVGVPYADRVAKAAAKQGYGKQGGRGALKF